MNWPVDGPWVRLAALFAASLIGLAVARAETVHTVERGETLFALSRRYGVSVQAIRDANPGVNLDTLRIGQRIRIPLSQTHLAPRAAPATPPQAAPAPAPPTVRPPPSTPVVPAPERTHRVESGDTLHRIATRHGVTVEQLREWNGLAGDTIRVGQLLRISPGPSVATPPLAAPSATDAPPPPPRPEPTPDRTPRPETPRSSSGPLARPPQYLFVAPVEKEINAPRIRSGRWRYIVVHHSGTRSGSAKVFDYYHRNIRRMENGMAYHFVIGNGNGSGDGQIEVGERWRRQLQGGHLASDELNEVSIGICLVGDFNQTRPTRKQIAALVELIDYLSQRTGPRPRFRAHREINPKPTDCPGKFFPVAALHRLFDTRR